MLSRWVYGAAPLVVGTIPVAWYMTRVLARPTTVSTRAFAADPASFCAVSIVGSGGRLETGKESVKIPHLHQRGATAVVLHVLRPRQGALQPRQLSLFSRSSLD